jgi:dTDP-4-dehydrorhamnose reductase
VIEQNRILFTGGSGLLGSEFERILPDINYPSSSEFNVADYKMMEEWIRGKDISMLIHAAAFTSPPRIDKDPLKALETNIVGTANVVKLCMLNEIRLVYISTDYVFNGEKGNYREDDPVFPVNKYAWSKLGGECAARMHDNSLIIRTTFGPNVFPYEKAFIDQWTSRESVRVITGLIAGLIDKDVTGVVHACGERKTVFEFARGLDETRYQAAFHY